jgi:hypothetical protein
MAGSTAPEYIYRSRFWHEVEFVADQLEHAGIPFIRQHENYGVRLAMPMASGVACPPGSWFLVVVRGQDAARAHTLVDSLPVSHDE